MAEKKEKKENPRNKNGVRVKRGPPLGNQNAVGNSGRPPKWDPSVEAKALVEYAKSDNAIVLRKFAGMRGYSDDRFDDWCEQNVEFREAYELARTLIGARREELVQINAHNKSPFERYATMYDRKLKQHEIEMYKAKQPSDTNATATLVLIDKGGMDIKVTPKDKDIRSVDPIPDPITP